MGLWLSVEHKDAFIDWRDWCETENCEPHRLKFKHIVSLKDTANILLLDSIEKMRRFTNKYKSEKEWETSGTRIDWEVVCRAYGGLIITPYFHSLRLEADFFWYYTFDCSSGCIWDLRTINSFESI